MEPENTIDIVNRPVWYEFVLSVLDTGVVVVDKDYRIVLVNEAVCKLIHSSKESLSDKPVHEVFRFNFERGESLFVEAIKEKKPVTNIEGTLIIGEDAAIPVRVTAAVHFDENEQFISGVYIIKDNQEIIKLKDDIKNASIWDRVSGLYSRDHFFYLLELEFAKARRYKYNLSLMLIDIDNFKKVNEAHGKKAGDLVLKKLGKVLRGHVRFSDVLGRLDGDRFALILPQVSKTKMSEMADRMRYLIEKSPIVEDDYEVRITVSIGTASYPNFKVTDWKDMLKAADIALYMAKEMGRNRTESF